MSSSFRGADSSSATSPDSSTLRLVTEPPLLEPVGSVQRQRVAVTFEYPVLFTEGCLDLQNSALAWAICQREPERLHRVQVVFDGGLVDAWPDLAADVVRYFEQHPARLQLCGAPLTIPGGESSKNDPSMVGQLQRTFQEAHLDRQSIVAVFGGGAVQDSVGYAAATTHRGLRVLRLPTTVLAQNDSGVGVKNGINAFATKNFLGTFAPPWAVINDFRFLTTLERRDRIAGMAEAVKVALIRDAVFFEWLEAHARQLRRFEPAAVQHMVRRAAELHLEHIATSGDPFETGSARPLDFGHWAAHKLESMTDYELRHGEAVAIGIALDSLYSAAIGLLPRTEARRISAVLRQLGFDLYHPALETTAEGRLVVLDGLREFREHLGGELTLTLLRGIGRGIEVHEVNEAAICSALTELKTPPGW